MPYFLAGVALWGVSLDFHDCYLSWKEKINKLLSWLVPFCREARGDICFVLVSVVFWVDSLKFLFLGLVLECRLQGYHLETRRTFNDPEERYVNKVAPTSFWVTKWSCTSWGGNLLARLAQRSLGKDQRWLSVENPLERTHWREIKQISYVHLDSDILYHIIILLLHRTSILQMGWHHLGPSKIGLWWTMMGLSFTAKVPTHWGQGLIPEFHC